MVLARPEASYPTAPPAPRERVNDAPQAAVTTAPFIPQDVVRIADQPRPRSWPARLMGRHPLPEEAVAIEAAVSRRGLAELLEHRTDGSIALHDLPGPDGSTIDHLLISPTGVYVIAALQIPSAMVMVLKDDLLISGRQTGAITQVEEQAQWVTQQLGLGEGDLAARPVIVVNGYRHLSVRQGPDVTSVLSTRGLREFLDRRAPALSPERLAQVSQQAMDPQTWQLAVAAPRAEPGQVERFDTLVESVRRARRTRTVLGFMTTLVVADSLLAVWICMS